MKQNNTDPAVLEAACITVEALLGKWGAYFSSILEEHEITALEIVTGAARELAQRERLDDEASSER